MRPTLARVLASVFAFIVALSAVLLWRGVINLAHVRQSAMRLTGLSQPAPPAPRRIIIFDKRDYVESEMSYEELKAAGEQERRWTERVAPDVFGSRGLEHWGLCDGTRGWARRAQSEADLAWALAAGQFVPWVRATYAGSFTAPHAQETLYMIDTGECNTRWGPFPASRRFAIYDGAKLRAVFKASAAESVFQVVPDVDGDGVDELLLAEGLEPIQSSFRVQLRLVSLKGGTRRELQDFGVAYVYGCLNVGCRDVSVTLPVIYYLCTGATCAPECYVDFYRGDCWRDEGCKDFPRPGTWRYLKSGRLTLVDYVAPLTLRLEFPQLTLRLDLPH